MPYRSLVVFGVVAGFAAGGLVYGQEDKSNLAEQSVNELVRKGASLSSEEAAQLETRLKARPNDLSTRARLLGYYFGSVREGSTSLRVSGSASTIEARRRHILWIISNHPDAEIAGISAATLDPQGHSLADARGFEQAKALWIKQTETHRDNTSVLGNAAKFLQLLDKELAESILKRAQTLEPEKPEWSSRLGYLYALGILGVDGLTQNGIPSSFNPSEVGGEFAKRARRELEQSSNATVSGIAGSILFQYGSMLQGIANRKLEPKTLDLAERLLKKAQELEPTAGWSMSLEQLYKIRELLKPSDPGTESVPPPPMASPETSASKHLPPTSQEVESTIKIVVVTGEDGTNDEIVFSYGPVVGKVVDGRFAQLPYTNVLSRKPRDLRPGSRTTYTFRVPLDFCSIGGFSLSKTGEDAWYLKEVWVYVNGRQMFFDRIADRLMKHSSDFYMGGWLGSESYEEICSGFPTKP